MRICYFGTYERAYPRNALTIEALRRAGMTVYECHAPVWELQRDKSGSHRGVALLRLLLGLLWAYLLLSVRYLRMPKHDVMIVGYVGQIDMPLAWLLSHLRAVPLVFNPLVSLYDTICDDRRLIAPDSVAGRLLYQLDRRATGMADLVLIDTQAHGDYFVQRLGVRPERLRVLSVGADDRVFSPRSPERATPDVCQVLFVGKLIPLHGITTILRAAALLRNEPIRFTIIGSGQESAVVRQMCAELQLQNVEQIDWVDYERLPNAYAQADIALGIFGDSEKAARVVPNKLFQALAMGRATITADTPAIRTMLAVGEEVLVCPPADPEALAAQIRRLAADGDLRDRVAAAGYVAFATRYSIAALAQTLAVVLHDLVPGYGERDQMEWGDQPEFYGPRHRYRENYLFAAIRRFSPGPRILDAACGAGTLARRLAQANYQVLAVDLSRNFLSYVAKQPEAASIAIQNGDLTQLPYQSDCIDGIVAGEVLEHLSDDHPAFQEFWRVLRPGGVCVISVPAEPRLWDWHDSWAGHERRYTRADLTLALEQSGFEVLQIHHFGFPLVRAFHQYVYLPRYRRALSQYRGRLNQLSTNRLGYRLLTTLVLLAFQFDRLFNRLPLGIGLIAIARKPDAPHANA